MCVVQLNRYLLGQLGDVPVCAVVPADEVLEGRGCEEVFLAQAEFLAGRRRVGGVKNAGDGLGARPVGEGSDIVAPVEGLELYRIEGLRRP